MSYGRLAAMSSGMVLQSAPESSVPWIWLRLSSDGGLTSSVLGFGFFRADEVIGVRERIGPICSWGLLASVGILWVRSYSSISSCALSCFLVCTLILYTIRPLLRILLRLYSLSRVRLRSSQCFWYECTDPCDELLCTDS
jgi:hypothetical protein